MLPMPPQVRIHLAAKNPEAEKAEAEKRAEEAARLKCVRDATRAACMCLRRHPRLLTACAACAARFLHAAVCKRCKPLLQLPPAPPPLRQH